MKDFRQRLRALHTADRQPLRAELPAVDVEAGVAVIRLYDPIDSWGEYWGVSAKEFAATLDELGDDVNEIRLHVNSPGGDVFDGIAILNALRSHPALVVVTVDGIAASAASFIAAGADELIMARNSELMIHDAWGLCVGNAEDMRKLAGDLDRISSNIASIYADKAGGTVADWRAAMVAETWYSAEEAVAAGLADRVEDRKADAEVKNRFDLTIFTYAGRDHAPAPDPQISDGAPVGQTSTTDKEPDPGNQAATSAAKAADVPADDPLASGTEEDGEGDLSLRLRALQLQVDAVT